MLLLMHRQLSFLLRDHRHSPTHQSFLRRPRHNNHQVMKVAQLRTPQINRGVNNLEMMKLLAESREPRRVLW